MFHSPPARPSQSSFVEQRREEFVSLIEAAQSSLNFWDNPWDDEDWNAA
jgi:hypothetical protein